MLQIEIPHKICKVLLITLKLKASYNDYITKDVSLCSLSSVSFEYSDNWELDQMFDPMYRKRRKETKQTDLISMTGIVCWDFVNR